MFQKNVFIGMLIAAVYSVTGFAAGTHEQEHAAPEQHDEQVSHGATSGHADDDHGHAGSPVGQPATASEATKVINVVTLDTMRYVFDKQPELEDGDIVRFVITNNGKIPHEFSIGDEAEQQAHREMMRSMPDMVHEDGNTITINPGETRELTWKFAAGSEVVFACNIPGHYEAGMFEKAGVASGHEHGH